jgi:hypothetical protein
MARNGRRGRTRTPSSSGGFIKRGALIRAGVWGMAFCAVVTAMLMSWFGLRRLFFTRNPHFTLERIDVDVSMGNLEKRDIRALLELEPGTDNLYAINPEEIRNTLLEDPIIEEVEVVRILPDTLHINVVSRTPVAQLLHKGGKTIDAAGYVMPPGKTDAIRNLPVILGIRDVADAPIGTRISSMGLHTAINFLRLRDEIPLANRMLDVQSLACQEKAKTLIVILKGNPTYSIRSAARIYLPTDGLEAALRKGLDSLQVRSLARQQSAYVNCTFRRIYITP